MHHIIFFFFLFSFKDIPAGTLFYANLDGCSSPVMLDIPFPESCLLSIYFLVLVAFLFQQLPVKECMNSKLFRFIGVTQHGSVLSTYLIETLCVLEIIVLNFQHYICTFQLEATDKSFVILILDTYVCPVFFSLEGMRI